MLFFTKSITNGNRANFKKDKCEIVNNNGQIIGVANLIQGVYKLNVKQREQYFAGLTLPTEMTWHSRFGPLNSKYMNAMKNKNLVTSLSYSGTTEVEKGDYEICCEGKQYRKPFSHKGIRAKQTLLNQCIPMYVARWKSYH